MNNGLIVCNAGPLIALSLVGNLDLKTEDPVGWDYERTPILALW